MRVPFTETSAPAAPRRQSAPTPLDAAGNDVKSLYNEMRLMLERYLHEIMTPCSPHRGRQNREAIRSCCGRAAAAAVSCRRHADPVVLSRRHICILNRQTCMVLKMSPHRCRLSPSPAPATRTCRKPYVLRRDGSTVHLQVNKTDANGGLTVCGSCGRPFAACRHTPCMAAAQCEQLPQQGAAGCRGQDGIFRGIAIFRQALEFISSPLTTAHLLRRAQQILHGALCTSHRLQAWEQNT